jgi:hypothetical protein
MVLVELAGYVILTLVTASSVDDFVAFLISRRV